MKVNVVIETEINIEKEYTCAELAKIFKTSTRTIQRLIEENKLEATKNKYYTSFLYTIKGEDIIKFMLLYNSKIFNIDKIISVSKYGKKDLESEFLEYISEKELTEKFIKYCEEKKLPVYIEENEIIFHKDVNLRFCETEKNIIKKYLLKKMEERG